MVNMVIIMIIMVMTTYGHLLVLFQHINIFHHVAVLVAAMLGFFVFLCFTKFYFFYVFDNFLFIAKISCQVNIIIFPILLGWLINICDS